MAAAADKSVEHGGVLSEEVLERVEGIITIIGWQVSLQQQPCISHGLAKLVWVLVHACHNGTPHISKHWSHNPLQVVAEACDTASAADTIFDASFSSDASGRELNSLEWSQDLAAGSNPVLAALVNEVNQRSTVKAKVVLTVPAASVAQLADGTYTLAVTVTNFLAQSATAKLSFSQVGPGTAPVISIVGGPTQSFKIAAEVNLASALEANSVCAGRTVSEAQYGVCVSVTVLARLMRCDPVVTYATKILHVPHLAQYIECSSMVMLSIHCSCPQKPAEVQQGSWGQSCSLPWHSTNIRYLIGRELLHNACMWSLLLPCSCSPQAWHVTAAVSYAAIAFMPMLLLMLLLVYR